MRYPVEFRERGHFPTAPLRCATFCGSENTRPHSKITGNGLTPRPSVCAPGYVAAHVALAALRPTLRQMVEESA